VLLVLAVVVIWVVIVYNRLVRDRQRVKTAWSDIDVQLKRRYDLIPKLVAGGPPVVAGEVGKGAASEFMSSC
jgi:hypothetical protein